jgi:hypothetical protein
MEIARKWDWGPREIEGEVLVVHNHFDNMRVKPILNLIDLGHQSGDGDGIVRQKRPYRFVDDGTSDKGFIPLDIDDDPGPEVPGNLGHSITSRGMVWRGHHPLAAKALNSFQYPLIIRGDDNIIDQFRFTHPFINVVDHRFAENMGEGFPFESCGTISGRNDSRNSHNYL